MKVVALIMAGGKGERFWPRSRKSLPKQFLVIDKNPKKESMLQKTVHRLKNIIDIDDIFILTNDEYVEKSKEQLGELPIENIIAEPCGRNTAPAINFGLAAIKKKYDQFVMLVLPSDHVIMRPKDFIKTLKIAIDYAEKNPVLMTIGVIPTGPNTDYGYIKYDSKSEEDVVKVEKFVEKPDLKTAKKYFASEEYLWNSGMFIWRSDVIENAFQKYLPEQKKAIDHIMKKWPYKSLRHFAKDYSKIESISVDYGIMEKADNVCVIPGDFGWDDVGSWLALPRLYGKDENKNTLVGNVKSIDSVNSIIYSDKQLVVADGLENLIIVATEDVVLVTKKEDIHNIKDIIKSLDEEGKDKYI